MQSAVFGEKLKQQVEDRLKFYECGDVPRKNVDVMKEAMEEAALIAPPTENGVDGESGKKKKKKNKKRKISEVETAEADESVVQNGSMKENGDNLDDTTGEPKKKKEKEE